MEGLLKDGLLNLLRYFHNPELVGSMLLLYVIVSRLNPRFRTFFPIEQALLYRRCDQLLRSCVYDYVRITLYQF